ncbi:MULTISPECIES: Druantia anti-phage system protein DruA [unclassified Rhizobacter]|uniref:Druantia anti-phage system protein DruA n=1 Tax=unclassified Rhizobacter TaxID=2640088 RepID=UPI0006FA4147|nr:MULTISPECIES: Druantia anti-phage system protein DruA [unclassified Rhizobacter]KQU79419.1 hypothetical protein ASC88_18055 [Rhizobacter sp. Root29]KQW05270.1 hypothetical protein ASC98_26460 [Rhizobacter sp. Root1238]
MTVKNAVAAFTPEARIKRHLRKHLIDLGFTKDESGALVLPDASKDTVRTLHRKQREDKLAENAAFVSANLPNLQRYFASGADVRPEAIRPVLEPVTGEGLHARLFRLASLTWSVPVSAGFGRRMRYLVVDQSNGKLIGIFAIGDPVYNLGARDSHIGWSIADREQRLVNLMDAYVLGAVPPYNMLLGGKLVACLVRTREVYEDFRMRYGGKEGIISGASKNARLLAVTTSSSMGRSSIYNRLRLGDTSYFTSIGFTGGWGHFHIPDDLFDEMRVYLRSIDHGYADMHAFGEGPNWRLRTVRAALRALGFKEDVLKHGIQREVFLSATASNSLKILRGEAKRPLLSELLSVKDVGALAVSRWMKGRGERRPQYHDWSSSGLRDLIRLGSTQSMTEAGRNTGNT